MVPPATIQPLLRREAGVLVEWSGTLVRKHVPTWRAFSSSKARTSHGVHSGLPPPPLPPGIRSRTFDEPKKESGTRREERKLEFNEPLSSYIGKYNHYNGNVMFLICMIPGILLFLGYLYNRKPISENHSTSTSSVHDEGEDNVTSRSRTYQIRFRGQQVQWLRENDLGKLIVKVREGGPELWRDIWEIKQWCGGAESEKQKIGLTLVEEDWEFLCERARQAKLSEEKTLRVLVAYGIHDSENQ